MTQRLLRGSLLQVLHAYFLKRSKKRFTEPFLEAIKGLNLASNKSILEQKFELKRFIDEFGTHYPSSTIMGVKLLTERRYSFNERGHSQTIHGICRPIFLPLSRGQKNLGSLFHNFDGFLENF